MPLKAENRVWRRGKHEGDSPAEASPDLIAALDDARIDVSATSRPGTVDRTRHVSADGRALRLPRTGRRRRSGYARNVLLAAGTAALLIGITYVIVSLLLSRQAL